MFSTPLWSFLSSPVDLYLFCTHSQALWMWSFLVFLILSLIFSFKMIKNVQRKFFVDSKFRQLEIFPNQIFQNYDFGLLINIYLYKVKIYLLRSCSTWLANMINLIWCSHSGPDPVRWCGPIPDSNPDETYFCHFFAFWGHAVHSI